MKRTLIISGIGLLLALIAGLGFYLHGKRYTLYITEAQIREQLATHFPLERRLLLLLHWRLENPQINFLPERQRVRVSIDAQLNIRVEGQPANLGGHMEVETAVRYDTERGAFFLIDPVITQLAIDGIPPAYTARAQDSARDLLAEVFRQKPVYTLSRTDLTQGSARLLLKKVEIQDNGILVEMGL